MKRSVALCADTSLREKIKQGGKTALRTVHLCHNTVAAAQRVCHSSRHIPPHVFVSVHLTRHAVLHNHTQCESFSFLANSAQSRRRAGRSGRLSRPHHSLTPAELGLPSSPSTMPLLDCLFAESCLVLLLLSSFACARHRPLQQQRGRGQTLHSPSSHSQACIRSSLRVLTCAYLCVACVSARCVSSRRHSCMSSHKCAAIERATS